MKRLVISTRKDILGYHAQVTKIGEHSNLEGWKLQREINTWVIENKLNHKYNGSWEWSFADEKDLVWFLLKWQ